MPDKNIIEQRKNKKIAFIVHSTKLSSFEPGLDRGSYIARILSNNGYQVDLITSAFQHWKKEQRSMMEVSYSFAPYGKPIFIPEPGYKKNIDPHRIISHKIFNKNLKEYLNKHKGEYDAVWIQLPPNNIAATAVNFAKEEGIPAIADLNDLWPEAMRMVIDIPIISDIAFKPMYNDAKTVFNNVSGIIGTSDEYANHYKKYTNKDIKNITVYVGNDLNKFDSGVKSNNIIKPDDEIWVTYAGTLGKSYDIETLINTFDFVQKTLKINKKQDEYKVKLKILGDGPDKEKLIELTNRCSNNNIEFLGYIEYGLMAAYLNGSDITINSLVKDAPQSIVSKIGDYLAAGTAIINTGNSFEMINLCKNYNIGLSVPPGNIKELSDAIIELVYDTKKRETMGDNARKLAEDLFDRKKSYQQIVDFIDEFLLS